MTTDPEMISAQDLIVQADYGQILVFSYGGGEEDEDGHDHIGHLRGAAGTANLDGLVQGASSRGVSVGCTAWRS